MQSGLPGQIAAGPDSHGHDDQIRGKGLFAGPDPGHPALSVPQDLGGRLAGVDLDIFFLQMLPEHS